MHEVLNKQIPDDDGEKADHDFDFIRHDKNCDYSDSEKGIQINVDKIIGSTQGEVCNNKTGYNQFQGMHVVVWFVIELISFVERVS